MTFKGQNENTLCGGTISYTINSEARIVAANFKQITPAQHCKTCPYSTFCKQLFKTETSAQIAPAPSKDKSVLLKTFTGMEIGYYPIHKMTQKYVEIKAKETDATLRFDVSTGMQVNAKDPRFANMIQVTQ